MVTVTCPVHRVVMVLAPAGKEYVPLWLTVTVDPKGSVAPGETVGVLVGMVPLPLELSPPLQADSMLNNKVRQRYGKMNRFIETRLPQVKGAVTSTAEETQPGATD